MVRRSRIPHYVGLAIVVIAAIGSAGLWIVYNDPTASQAGTMAIAHAEPPPRPKPNLPPMSFDPGVPQRLIVEQIGLDAPVQGVATNAKGEMDAPVSADAVAWYRPGYLPGTLGNAVLAAHYLHTSGKGAFYRLGELAAGDTVTLKTDQGVQYFTVTGSKTLPSGFTDLADIFGPSPSAGLNLITCSGEWDEASRQYRDRLVVFTTFERETIE